jgi:hypothetical protein
MCGTSTNVEKGAIRTGCDQPPVVIHIKEADGGLLVPNTVTLDVARIVAAAQTFDELLHWYHTGFGSDLRLASWCTQSLDL